jgi:hypothetical protein
MIDLNNLPPRLTRREASEYLKMKHGISYSPQTLAKLACIGGGPVYRKIGTKTVAYDINEVDQWAKAKIGEPISNTSEQVA